MEIREALGWGPVADAIGEVDVRRLARRVVDEFRAHQLLIAAGGIAFRVLLATVVGGLFIRVIDDAVVTVLENKDVFWVTFGAAIAVWQISGAVRASGQTLNRIYGVEEQRPFLEELWTSIKTAAAVAVILIATLAVVRLGPFVLDDLFGDSAVGAVVSFLVRWSIAAALLTLAVGIVLRTAPAIERPLPWISFGSALTVAGWIVSSVLFGLYVTVFASLGSVDGALLAAFLLVEYLYVAAIVFLGGLVIDHLVQKRASG